MKKKLFYVYALLLAFLLYLGGRALFDATFDAVVAKPYTEKLKRYENRELNGG